jgi:CDK-activating kinase assembly factor MAT1
MSRELVLSQNVLRFIHEIDPVSPNRKPRTAACQKENAALIELNQQREEAHAQALKEQEEAERRECQLRAEEEEHDAREGERRALMNNLENCDADAARLAAQARAPGRLYTAAGDDALARRAERCCCARPTARPAAEWV